VPRNPTWSTDELLLAVDLYLNHPRARTTKDDPALIETSAALRALPIHLERPDAATFRNVNSVFLKLQNLKAVDPTFPGLGMRAGGGPREAALLERYVGQPLVVAELAAAIKRQGLELRKVGGHVDAEEDGDGVSEGAILIAVHRRRERRSSGAKKAAVLAATGRLECEGCGFDFVNCYGEIGRGFAECHHTKPLTDGVRLTRLDDLAIVCANCHRMIHRRSPQLSLHELRTLLL